MHPILTNDAVVLGLLIVTLALIFHTSNSESPFWQKFYKYVPSLLLCYFIPSIYNSVGLISGDVSHLYDIASQYLLPASLILLTLSLDFKTIIRLGPKAIIIFLAGSFGVIIGGPIALLVMSVISPQTIHGLGPNAVWRGMATIAGSWIGGGANQTAMKEVFKVGDNIFSSMIAVDVLTSNVWLAILLYGAGISDKIDKFLKADSSSITFVENKIKNYQSSMARIPSFTDIVKICAVGFGLTGLAHLLAGIITPFMKTNFPELAKFSLTSDFFWIVVIATTGGLLLSFTPLRKLEGAGASKFGSLFLYVLVATIGMKMNILAIFEKPDLFLIGLIWITVHIVVLLIVAKLIKSPFFFVAVGSQANIGGAASAPIVASAFSPSLASVGVLLAVLGYALGTYGGWLCGIIMRMISVH